MNNILDKVYKFNLEGGLLEKEYVDSKECAYPLEEALEGFGDLPYLATRLAGDELNKIPTPLTPKELSRQIIALVEMDSKPTSIADVDRLDKHIDIIVYSIGSIYKLGLTPKLLIEALDVVSEANLTKLSVGVDSMGKQMKPSSWVGPEVKLQEILNKGIK